MIIDKLITVIRGHRSVHQVPQALRDLDRAMQLVVNRQQETTTLAKARETLLAKPEQPPAVETSSPPIPSLRYPPRWATLFAGAVTMVAPIAATALAVPLQPGLLGPVLLIGAVLGVLPLLLIATLALVTVYSPDPSRRGAAAKILDRLLATLRPREPARRNSTARR